MSRTGLSSSTPQAGTKLQVIGAGLPRSGTNSFCDAVSLLLNGPAYHAGVQTALAPTSGNVLALTKALRLRAQVAQLKGTQDKLAASKRQELKQVLAQETAGWITVADAPFCILVPELMEIYPDAVVVCPTREREIWAKSMWKAARLGNPKVLTWIYFWVPVLRHAPTMWASQTPIWKELYGTNIDSEEDGLQIWDRHHAWLREVVPKDKLFFVDVKDGWQPLCRALQVSPPKDVPFPKLNDGEALEKVMGDLAMKGILAWGAVLVAMISTLWILLRWLL